MSVQSAFQEASITTSQRKSLLSIKKLAIEPTFINQFTLCVLTILQSKKDVANVDNVLSFLKTLFSEVNSKSNQILTSNFSARGISINFYRFAP
jgi:hypothetical protein